MNKIFILLLSLNIFFLTCNKDATVNNDDSDSNINLKYLDTFSISTKTVLNVPVDGKNRTNILLGETNDSRFGKSKASFYTEFSLSKNAYETGANPILDSIVLVLDQKSSYGELANPVDVKIYELSGRLHSTQDYNNNTVLNVNGNLIAEVSNFKFSKGATSLRIPMKMSFGNNLLDQFGTSIMENSANFKNFFNGLYLTSSSSNGNGIVSLRLKTDNTKMELYFHSDTESKGVYSFIVDANDIHVNQYINDNSGSEASFASNNADNQEFAFVSSMSGFRTLLSFPDLTSLNNIIINKAELVIYQADFGSIEADKNPVPKNLFLYQNLHDTALNYLPDFSLTNPEPFGGEIKNVEIEGENTIAYTFYITKYIQSLVNNSAKTNELYLSDITNNEGNRIKIGGTKHNKLPIKLNIIYSEIKK